MKKKDFLPMKVGCTYTIYNSTYFVEVLEVDAERGIAHGKVCEPGKTIHYASWWSESGEPVLLDRARLDVEGQLPSWEDSFPWDAIHPRYKWATLDADADVWEVHSEKPTYVLDEEAYYSNDGSDAGSNTLSDPAWNLPMPPKGSGAVRIKRPE